MRWLAHDSLWARTLRRVALCEVSFDEHPQGVPENLFVPLSRAIRASLFPIRRRIDILFH